MSHNDELEKKSKLADQEAAQNPKPKQTKKVLEAPRREEEFNMALPHRAPISTFVR